jgi:hypothetical protein
MKRNGYYSITQKEAAIIREIALEESRRNGNGQKRVVIEAGVRFNTKISSHTIKPDINVILVSKNTDAVDDYSNYSEDTDLYDRMDWQTFRKRGFKLSEKHCRAIIDFYLYEVKEDRSMCGNIQVHFDKKGMYEIHADSPKKLWERK